MMRTEIFKLLKMKSYGRPSYMDFYWSKWLLELKLIVPLFPNKLNSSKEVTLSYVCCILGPEKLDKGLGLDTQQHLRLACCWMLSEVLWLTTFDGQIRYWEGSCCSWEFKSVTGMLFPIGNPIKLIQQRLMSKVPGMILNVMGDMVMNKTSSFLKILKTRAGGLEMYQIILWDSSVDLSIGHFWADPPNANCVHSSWVGVIC